MCERPAVGVVNGVAKSAQILGLTRSVLLRADERSND